MNPGDVPCIRHYDQTWYQVQENLLSNIPDLPVHERHREEGFGVIVHFIMAIMAKVNHFMCGTTQGMAMEWRTQISYSFPIAMPQQGYSNATTRLQQGYNKATARLQQA